MESQLHLFDLTDERTRRQRAWDHVRGPWSWRRAWNLVCATLAAVPGVRRYVLSTTPLSAHPMFETYKRAEAKAPIPFERLHRRYK